MDITLVRTFLAVASTRNFVNAADTLHVTQSAVSMRIQRLEDLLGQVLFERSKAGVRLTHAGYQFEPMARSFMHLWDETRFSVSLPERYDDRLSLACEDSLWPELSSVWVTNFAQRSPKTALSFQVSTPETITGLMQRGLVQVAVLYNPQVRAGFLVEKVMDDRLILVTGNPDRSADLADDYIYSDWGPEFSLNHARWFPDMIKPQLSMAVGTGIAKYLVRYKKASYLPHRVADDYIDDGRLFWLREAPTMEYPAYVVRSREAESAVVQLAVEELYKAARNAPWIEI